VKIVDKRTRRRQMGYSLLRGNNNQPQQSQFASKENELKIKREISILKKCRHPNVVQLLEVMDNSESRKIYMALEYSEYGEIEWRDENEQPVMTVDEARKIFRDVVNGLDYCNYNQFYKLILIFL
jgi:serine/threonine protein kinase